MRAPKCTLIPRMWLTHVTRIQPTEVSEHFGPCQATQHTGMEAVLRRMKNQGGRMGFWEPTPERARKALALPES